jgi:hypothetical protein
MKQSSIEWIYNNLKSHFEHDGDLLEAVKMSLEQAKAMHKEEIVDSIVQYMMKHHDIFTEQAILNTVRIAEQYYKQTYETSN